MIAFMHVATNEDNEDAQNQSNTDNLILLLNHLTKSILDYYQLATSIYDEKDIFLNKMHSKIIGSDFEILKKYYISI